MNITMENFKTAKYDVFSIFDDRWGLCTAGTPREYNTMTIGWGTMGTIWGPPKKGKQIITVFIRESRRTHQILQKEDEFTVCFFPEKYRKDLGILGSKSGNDVPDKISLTSLTPKMLKCGWIWRGRADLCLQKNLCGQNGERRSAGIYARYFI